MAAGKDQSIVIKKIKKVSGGHHGGAWKVAYADFVTAMMAFFLLLWLLASTSEVQKQGIADYFTPATGIPMNAGSAMKGGQTEAIDGMKKTDKSTIAIIASGQPAGIGKNQKESLIEADLEQAEFDKAKEDIEKQVMEDPALKDLAQNILIKVTPEGLQIDVMDSDKYAMFLAGTANLSPFGMAILGKLTKVIERMPNYISISGHTDAEQLSARGGTYTNWELSAERANTARRFMITKEMVPERVAKVVGLAATTLLKPEDPLSPQNRRITLVLLRGDHMASSSYMQNRPGSLLTTQPVDLNSLKKREPVKQ